MGHRAGRTVIGPFVPEATRRYHRSHNVLAATYGSHRETVPAAGSTISPTSGYVRICANWFYLPVLFFYW
eukprot:3936289-Rhodomonas_salina.3